MTYDRLNAHYETAHRLGWLLFDALGIDDLFAPGEAQSFSFLLNMNQLFERFVTRVVEQVLPAARYRVTSQSPFKSVVWNVSSQRPYTSIIPDVIVERRGESDGRVAIDAKYKLYDERGFDPGDIYQTFLYAFALGATASGGVPTSLLLYPATAKEPRSTRLRIRRLSGGTESGNRRYWFAGRGTTEGVDGRRRRDTVTRRPGDSHREVVRDSWCGGSTSRSGHFGVTAPVGRGGHHSSCHLRR